MLIQKLVDSCARLLQFFFGSLWYLTFSEKKKNIENPNESFGRSVSMCNLLIWIFIWDILLVLHTVVFLVAVPFAGVFFSSSYKVFTLIALSGQDVDYCSYSLSKEGHLYVFQC